MNLGYGGLELYFSYVPSVDVSILLTSNIEAYQSFSPMDDDTPLGLLSVRFSSVLDVDTNETFIVVSTEIDEVVVDQSDFSCNSETSSRFNIRIFFFNSRISVYLNNKWVYSYVVQKIEYPSVQLLFLTCLGDSIDITQVRRVELFDGRDAVYSDYEATADSAIQSIIQQRPIEIFSGVDREFEFTYDATKTDVVAHNINKYTEEVRNNSSMSSDGLVYAADVGISIDEWTAEHVGLITRMYRLSELDSGAERAAAALQKKARQSRTYITSTGRFDPRLEIADIHVYASIPLSGTGTQVENRSIIEDISMSLSDGNNSQTISGRKDI